MNRFNKYLPATFLSASMLLPGVAAELAQHQRCRDRALFDRGGHGRPLSLAVHKQEIRKLFRKGLSKREIAKRLKIRRTSVRRLLDNP